MAILPKAIYRFNAINVPMTFSTELEQVILKLTENHRRSRTINAILRRKKQSWRHNPPGLQTILQSYTRQNGMVLAQKQT